MVHSNVLLKQPELSFLADDASHAQAITEDDRFRRLLPELQWKALPKEVQRRFSRKAQAGASIIYRGQTTHLTMSLFGSLLVQGARLIGAPLPLDKRSNYRAAVVLITDNPVDGGQVWTRIYGRGAGFPQMVNSTKKFSGPTGLEEHVGGGVSMSLKLSVADGALYFSSVHYFLTAFGVRIKIPHYFTPGRMVIGHHDLGGGAFAFTLTLIHPVLGELINQTTIFNDMEEVKP